MYCNRKRNEKIDPNQIDRPKGIYLHYLSFAYILPPPKSQDSTLGDAPRPRDVPPIFRDDVEVEPQLSGGAIARRFFLNKMFVRYDPDFPAVFAAGLRFSLFVRKIYYTVDLYAHVTQPQGAPLPGEIT